MTLSGSAAGEGRTQDKPASSDDKSAPCDRLKQEEQVGRRPINCWPTWQRVGQLHERLECDSKFANLDVWLRFFIFPGPTLFLTVHDESIL